MSKIIGPIILLVLMIAFWKFAIPILVIAIIMYLILKSKKKKSADDITNSKKTNPYEDLIVKVDPNKVLSNESDNNLYSKKSKGKLATINKSKAVFNEFIVVDIETTGLDSTTDFIIEIACAKFKDGDLIDTYETLINPGISIPEHITKINNINNSMVEFSPSINEVLPQFLEFISDLPLVAHNASFDIKFINSNLALIDTLLTNPIIDTLAISRTLFTDIKNHKLDTIREYLNICTENSHRALPDCIACSEIYLRYCTAEKERKQSMLDKLSSEAGLDKQRCYSIVKEVLQKNNISLDYVRCGFTSTYFDIKAFYPFVRLKLTGKKYYILMDYSIEEIKSNIPNLNLEYEVAPKSESNKIRLLLNSPEDLYQLESIIIQDFNKCIESMEYYRDNVKIAEKHINDYLESSI